jgi:hypothetical protein
MWRWWWSREEKVGGLEKIWIGKKKIGGGNK